MGNKVKALAWGTVVAGAVGYVAGILTAPKSGKETRDFLGRAGSQKMRDAEKQLKSLHTELSGLLDNASGAGKSVQGEVIDKATRTRQKTREILSALHDGNARDDDLDSAVSELNKAISSIKNYFKK